MQHRRETQKERVMYITVYEHIHKCSSSVASVKKVVNIFTLMSTKCVVILVPITKLQCAIVDHKELSTALSECKKGLSEHDYTFIRLRAAYFKIISARRKSGVVAAVQMMETGNQFLKNIEAS